MIRPLLIAAAVLAATPAAAEVMVGKGGTFTVRHTLEIGAPVGTVYAAVGRPDRWWLSSHTWSGDAKNLSLPLQAGACFCERWKTNSVEHMRVVSARPDAGLVRLAGALGPLQGEGVSGAMTFEVKAKGAAATELVFTYTVRGFSPEEAAQWAKPVEGVLAAQLQSLKRHLEPARPGATSPR